MDKQEKLEKTESIPDNQIIARILAGEKEQYAILIRKFNQRLYRVGMSILDEDAEVEDAMQTAYIKAYENLKKFAFRSGFGTWLTRIMINESLLRLKKRKRLKHFDEDIVSSQHFQMKTTDMQTPAAKTINSELKQILEKAIRELPAKYKTVFIMREIEGLNTEETKNCLQISEVNVKVRLNRAKMLLKTSLGAYYKKEEILHFHLNRCDRMVLQVMNSIESRK